MSCYTEGEVMAAIQEMREESDDPLRQALLNYLDNEVEVFVDNQECEGDGEEDEE